MEPTAVGRVKEEISEEFGVAVGFIQGSALNLLINFDDEPDQWKGVST